MTPAQTNPETSSSPFSQILLTGVALILLGILLGVLAARFLPMYPKSIVTPAPTIAPTAILTGADTMPVYETTPTVEITLIPTPTATPSALLNLKWNMMTVKSPVSFFSSYRLYYPTTWSIKEYKNSPKANDEGFSNLVLTKEKTTLSILQGAGGAGTCLYPEDPEMEGMMSRYGPYKDILKSPLVWRWAMKLDDEPIPSYSVCEKKIEGNFVSSTNIGGVIFSGNDIDADTKDEINYILERIIIL